MHGNRRRRIGSHLETEMSATLARKLRRIGLTRTFTEFPNTVVVTDEQGHQIEHTTTKIIENRVRIHYSPEELQARQAAIVAEWRARRKRTRS